MCEYVLNIGIETIGGVRFRPEFSGFEMSHREGMKALSEWYAISATVSMVYEDEPPKRASVKKLMDESIPYATALLAVAELLKSQRRLTIDDINKLETLSEQMSDYWFKTGKNIFLKMHHLLEHVIDFIKRYGMFGRISEEGYEAVHPLVNDIKEKTASMVNLADRTKNFYNMFHVNLDPTVLAVQAQVEAATTRGPRGPYKKKSTRKEDPFECGDGLDDRVKVDGYVTTGPGELMKEERVEVYDMSEVGKVPDAWVKVFEHVLGIDPLKLEEAKYLK